VRDAGVAVIAGDDALEAVRRGVSGIVVSNHGARQLDTVPATVRPTVSDCQSVRLSVHLSLLCAVLSFTLILRSSYQLADIGVTIFAFL